MIKRFFKYLVNLVKEEYKLVILLILILFFGLFHLPYNLYVGGGIISLEKRLEVLGEYKETGSFNLSYVISSRATIPTYLLSYIFDWERESINDAKLSSDDNARDMWEREKMYLQEANDNAIISAYQKAQEKITIKKELVKVLYVDSDAKTNLKTGDVIVSVDNTQINDFADLKNIINKYNVGDRVNVTYLRDDEEKSGYFVIQKIDNEKKAGLYLIKLYEYDLEKEVKLNFKNSEGGPSGGFMLALAIYNRLTSEDLTKGRKIVGTGTIDSLGNVGKIGGIKYKLKGAVRNNADIFFVPEENYDEALQIKKEKGYDISVVKVKTLSDAIEYLKG